jgi:hypothetical protein
MLRISVACVAQGNGCNTPVTGPALGLTGRVPWANGGRPNQLDSDSAAPPRPLRVSILIQTPQTEGA